MKITFTAEIGCWGQDLVGTNGLESIPQNWKHLSLVIKSFRGYPMDIIKVSMDGKDVNSQLFMGKWDETEPSIVNEKPISFHQYWQ